jgi:prepilin-type N-terminal cleavage/methylation domain-containing protein
MIEKEKGFTLIEVLIAVLIFAIGILSMAALGALNYSYIRVNQARARIHIQTESVVDDIQQWARESATPPSGPTRFDSLYDATPSFGDTLLKTYTSGKCFTAVLFDNQTGIVSSDADSKIFLGITSVDTFGGRVIKDSVYFCLSNYGVGD